MKVSKWRDRGDADFAYSAAASAGQTAWLVGSGISTFAKHRLDIVAVGIKNKGGIVARRATFFHAAVSRRTVIGAACFQCSRVESVHLCAALSCECRVVLGG
jgi:hypothetical protein